MLRDVPNAHLIDASNMAKNEQKLIWVVAKTKI